MIPLEELVVRGVYHVRGRNIKVGIWTGNTWIGIRNKFGNLYLDESEVPERSCHAESFIEMLPDELSLVTYISRCQKCNELTDFDASRGETGDERWQHIAGPSDHVARPSARPNVDLFAYLEQYR